MSRRRRARLEGEAEPRELREVEAALNGRLHLELLPDVGVLADQLAGAARQGLVGRLPRLPEVHRTPALGDLVGDPRLETESRHVFELADGLVTEVAPELPDRRLRVRQAPEDEPDDQSSGAWVAGNVPGIRERLRSRTWRFPPGAFAPAVRRSGPERRSTITVTFSLSL
jgi:hypothetical protein